MLPPFPETGSAADKEAPVELISMVCIRADRAAVARSRVLDIDAVRDEVSSRPGARRWGCWRPSRCPWQLAAHRGGGVTWRTVLGESGMCWRPSTIDLALASGGAQLATA